MLKDIVFQHKKEKEEFLSKNYIWREKLSFAQKFLEKDLIKVITGPRRAGKSVFAFLLLKGKNFAYLNFDDENLLKVKNYDKILQAIFEVYSQVKFILFDEIQNLEKWEIFVNKLQRRGYNLILTGSNAKLLSKEMGTFLTGRYVSIEVFPFSFKEFLQAKNFNIKEEELGLPETKGKILYYLGDYLRYGGFPEVVVKGLEAKTYLQTLFDAVLLKDVVKRYKVRFSQEIYELATFLSTNFTSQFSFTRLKKSLGFRSVNTIKKYLKYLEEVYLTFSLNRFSFKTREQIKTPKKIYLVDSGFILAKSFQFSQNFGKLMENLFFVELLRRGYQANKDIFYYKTKDGREIDFVLREGIKIKKLIQISYQIANNQVREREKKSLLKGENELKCAQLEIVTWDQEGEERVADKTVKFLPLWKWLLK